ncbi:hypothetical protein PL11_002475 [Lentilactobacillus curieae]|uniref:Uncharacterized protein n=1 Tax=Lentilactobacillus curieae TaxID=1138822 RepID=A0A1S6QGW1_9LACO|nr:hypothetical protein [Lentilactobacillus curieae]AQW20856.1 hypothetical protein PL11_002475 [Lentilactobacillus curieae]
MNSKKCRFAKVFGIACLMGLSLSTGLTVQAQAAVIPKSIRGNWYQYLGDHHYARIRFTKHTVSYRNFNEGKYQYEDPIKSTAKNAKGKWVEIKSSKDHGTGTFYRVSKSGKYKQLQVAYGDDVERVTSFNYYRAHVHKQ